MSIESIGNNPLSNTTSTSLSNIASKSIPSYLEVWRRNPSWPVHTANSGDNKIVGLYAIYPPNSGNFISVVCSGDYTIDYGDGTVTNYSAGVTGYYNYDYNSIYDGNDYTNVPVILNSGSNDIAKTQVVNGTYDHGYNNGEEVILYNLSGVSPTEVKTNYPYYVTNATNTTFQISVEKSGQPLSWSTVGYANLLPYKVAKVTITPQAGQVLSSGNFFVKHNEPGLVNRHRTGWLEIIVASSGLSSLTISGSSTTTVQHSVLESVEIKEISSNLTSFSNLLQNCFNLKNFALDCSNGVTSMANLFNGCTNLISLRLADTKNVTSMSSMFSNCRNLVTIPFIDTSNVTDMGSVFNNCFNLLAIPSIDMSKVTNVNGAFAACRSLIDLPILDLNSVNITVSTAIFGVCSALKKLHIKNLDANLLRGTSFVGGGANIMFSLSTLILENMKNGIISISASSLFSTMSALKEIVMTNVTFGSTTSFIFSNCASLEKVTITGPSFANGTSLSSFFSNCSSLRNVLIPNTSGVTNMTAMFVNCTSLTEAPFLETQNVQSVGSMFSGCTSLVNIPNLNFSGVTAFTTVFNSCPSLSRIQASGMRFSFSVTNCMLGPSELNELYTNLPVVTGQILTVTGNYGTASDDITIATDKGWSVTG